ncbi:hypothetical protein HDU76_010497, partial [Blyttiomyces sp. JEL0837]
MPPKSNKTPNKLKTSDAKVAAHVPAAVVEAQKSKKVAKKASRSAAPFEVDLTSKGDETVNNNVDLTGPNNNPVGQSSTPSEIGNVPNDNDEDEDEDDDTNNSDGKNKKKKKVLNIKPYQVKHGDITKAWTDVTERFLEALAAINITTDTHKLPKKKTVSDRFNHLMDQFNEDEMESLRASGMEEEYEEREQLLTDIKEEASFISCFLVQMDMVATVKQEKSEKEKREAEKREVAGRAIVNAAMNCLVRERRESSGDGTGDDLD